MKDDYCEMTITGDAAFELERIRTIIESITGKRLNDSDLIILLCKKFVEKTKIPK